MFWWCLVCVGRCFSDVFGADLAVFCCQWCFGVVSLCFGCFFGWCVGGVLVVVFWRCFVGALGDILAALW